MTTTPHAGGKGGVGFEGRAVLVTGAANGIGRATALAFGRAGADVALLDVDGEGVERVAVETAEGGARTVVEVVDISDTARVRAAVRDAHARFGRLDAVANVAAIFPKARVPDVTEDLWDLVMGVNLRAMFFCCQEAINVMVAQGRGAIVNVSSSSAFRPLVGNVTYCASKAGIVGMSRVLALECARTGVRVNVVAPGSTASDQAVGQVDDPEALAESWVSGRWLTPDEQANAIVWACSDDASGLNGAIINVTAGIWMP
jgi:NAD(P)-dependent dehydrogenase (short-subunit alcohol dehydrogenase family)